MKLKYFLGGIFLFIQICSIVYARFIPERFFCWAPYDEETYLNTIIIVGDKSLSKKEVNNRYRYQVNGWEPRSVNNVFNIIEQYEKTYGENENAQVTVKYKTNGHKMKEWVYSNSSKK
ncbi:MAG: hypothetical protein KAJ23_16210 [Maribacter sp.]|nr:hypothetical protein [Maribacter sp.]